MANTYQFVSRTSQSASVATTVVVTSGAGQAIPRGALVTIGFANSSGVLPSSVVDSVGNTYVLADSALNTRVVGIYYCVIRKAIPAGGSWTANVAATSSSRMMDVRWCSRPNGTTATVLDAAATNAGIQHATGSSTAAATAAITPSGADSLLVTAVADAGAASSTPAASWTEDSDVLVTSAVLHMETQTRILTAASSVAAGSTLITTQVWAQTYAVFRLKPPIAYVKTASWNNTSSPPSTLAATVTQNAAIGDHILVRIFTGGLNPASACVDSVGNTYIRDDTGTFGGTGADYALFRSRLQFAHVAASTTITITGGASAVFYAGDAIKVTGATSITRAEFTTSAEGTGTTVASPTIIPVTANWIALGGIDSSFTSATPGTTGGTWVEDTDTNGTETQTLISTTFAQAAVGFAATVTPTQTFIDLGWNILQIDKPVVEVESVTGSSAASKTETFRAATAGDLLLLIVGTNENAGADNVTTPTGWTLLAQSRSGTTNVNLNLYGKIAVGGETSVLATGSATARIQTAFANLGQGYSLTIDASNTANSTSASLTGAVGSVTAVGSGGIAISAIAFKNAETTLVAGPANSTPYDQLGVNNEGSTASTQKVTVGWFYSDGVVAGAVYDNAPVITGTSAPYAGLNVILQPASASSPQNVGAMASTGTATASFGVTAPTGPAILNGSASGAAALAVTSPTAVGALAASSVSSAALSVTSPTNVGALAGSAITSAALSVTTIGIVACSGSAASSGTLAVTAPTNVGSMASTATGTGALAVRAPTGIAFTGATAAAAGSLSATAPGTVAFGGATGIATGALAVTAPGRIVFGGSIGSATGLLNVTAPGTLVVGAANASGTGTLAVQAPTQVGVLNGSGIASATWSVTAPTKITFGAGLASATGSLALTAASLIGSLSSVGFATGSLAITAPGVISSMNSTATSLGTLTVTSPGASAVGNMNGSASGSGVLFVSAATGTGNITSTATSVAALTITAPTRITFGQGVGTSSATLAVLSNTILTIGPGTASSTGILGVVAPTKTGTLSSTGFGSGTLAVSAPTYVGNMTSTGVSSATLAVSSGGAIVFQAAIASSSAVLSSTAPTRAVFSGGFGTANGTLVVTAPSSSFVGSLNASATAAGALFVAASGIVGFQPAQAGAVGTLAGVTAGQGRSSTRTLMGMGT